MPHDFSSNHYKEYVARNIAKGKPIPSYLKTDNVRKNTEVVYLDKNIGIEGLTRQRVDGIKIYHSKQRTHIVPVRRKE